ncbi:MAG: TetR/AcrR family transcriptional regulator C-terminal domain-containing protein [Actinobacteria bacterium]|nr:TetR/AcrR family transcriptional regulator C-terminal domain-containing protein [Actinomycetota bacterium]
MREGTRTGAKYVLGYSLMELARDKPFNKITIQDIVNNCGAGRQTFYNHFKDKYDLVNWIYETNTARIRNTLIKSETLDKLTCKILVHVKENQPLYANFFTNEGQNLLLDFIHKNTCNFYRHLTKRRYGERSLNDELDFSIQFYSHGSISMVKQWSKKGMQESPELMTERLFSSMPLSLRKFEKRVWGCLS